MGSSYKDGTHSAGSGHWSAVKLHLWKNNTASLDQDTINNVYGLGVSNGCMEVQTDANLVFFVGNDGTYNGSRLERLRITSGGNVLCNSSTPAYFGLPRVTTTQKNSLSGMVGGELVYDTSLHGVFFYSTATNSWRAI